MPADLVRQLLPDGFHYVEVVLPQILAVRLEPQPSGCPYSAFPFGELQLLSFSRSEFILDQEAEIAKKSFIRGGDH